MMTEITQHSSNNNEDNYVSFKEKIASIFSVTSESSLENINELMMESDFTNQQRNFVAECKRKLELPEHFDQWTFKEQYYHLINNTNKYFPIPKSLDYTIPAIFEDGDCGRSSREKPDWLDMNKFRRGQKFAQRYFTAVCLAQLMCLFPIFSFSNGLKTLISSQNSNTPYRAFKRYLSTICRVRNWFLEDPWDEKTKAHRDIRSVRRMHHAMRQKLCNIDDNRLDLASRIPNAQCPVLKTIAQDFRDVCLVTNNDNYLYMIMTKAKSLNQIDMSGTQFAFMGLMVLFPEQLGVHASDEDLEAFCYLWRGLGYLLGIEDKYNFCRGSLQDVRRRCKDFLEYWVKPNFSTVTPEWEHMSICLYEGLSYFIPVLKYKICLLYLCDIFGFDMPRFYNSLGLREKILYKFHKFVFGYLIRLPGVFAVFNMVIHVCLDWAVDFGPKKHSRLRKRSDTSYRPI